MANAYTYSNTAVQTTLAGSISSGATTITVGAVTGFPGAFPYVLALDYGSAAEELVTVTAVAGLNLTVTRGFGGTSAQSHSLGAVVRHVYNSVDATDFRTHEAATASVHGVTGALVGATQTQTLTNKTLTSPTINAGALSGTFTGSPTLSGNVTFSGTLTGAGALAGTFSGSPTFTGGPTFTTLSALWTRAAATDPAIRVRLDADTQSRLILQADGKQVWGSGSATGDTNLYRSAADTLQTDDNLSSSRAAAGSVAYSALVTADTFDRWRAYADGKQEWGTGALARDTNLYRSAAGTLKTDGDLAVVGNLSAANFNSGAWTTYTPAWTATTGTNPTIGNGTITGAYYRTGRMINVFVRLVWGSTSVAGNGGGSENWLFGLPVVPAASWDGYRVFNADFSDVSTAQHWGGSGVVDTGGSGRIGSLVATDHTTTAIWDSAAPVSVATGDILMIWGFYEATN